MLFTFAFASMSAGGIEPSQVLVLYNQSSDDGKAIAEYYQTLYPEVRLAGLNNVPDQEQISSDVYFNTIRPQVLGILNDDTQVIVTTRGLPLRINNGSPQTPGWNQFSSLESELTRIDSIDSKILMGNQAYYMPDFFGGNSLALNPYFKKGVEFDTSQFGIRLTSRLDGFNVEDVKASLDRAQRAYIGGGNHFIVDDDPNANGTAADRMEILANEVLPSFDVPFVYDSTDAFVQDSDLAGKVLGYVSHGVHGGAPGNYLGNGAESIQFDLADGAVFHSWESFNARTFNEGGNSYGQGTVGQWIARGGTAGVGHVAEPGVSVTSVTNEDVMFDRLLSGYSFVESAWQATAQVSFVNTVVGDPLMTFKPWIVGDVDMDGLVTWKDLGVLVSKLGNSDGQAWSPGDFNGDGEVDQLDLDLFGQGYDWPNSNTPYVEGDVDGDGELGLQDLNIIGTFYGLEQGAVYWQGDLTGDGRVSLADLNMFSNSLHETRPALTGDANGDGEVDLLDLEILSMYFSLACDGGYSEADFNNDGCVGLVDLGILGRYFGMKQYNIPEPGSGVLLGVLSLISIFAKGSRAASRGS